MSQKESGAEGGEDQSKGSLPPEATQHLSEYVASLSTLQKTELLQLLQGAKPKIVKPLVSDTGLRADGVNVDGADTGTARVLEENKIPKLPNFSGDSTSKCQTVYRVWEFEVLNLKNLFGEREIKRAIHRSVIGTAAQVLMRLGTEASLEQILEKFKLVFGSVVTNEQLLSTFYTAEQKPSESVAEWACRLEDLLCHPQLDNYTATQKNEMLKSKFFQGLAMENVKHAIRHRMTDGTYNEILVLARQAEEEKGAKGKAISKVQSVAVDPTQKMLDEIQKELKSLAIKVNQLENKIEKGKFQSKPKHLKTETKDEQPSGNLSVRPFTCNYCKKPGHMKRNCRKLLNTSSSAARSDP